MAQEETLDPLEQAWMTTAIAAENLFMSKQISDLFRRRNHDNIKEIFHRGRIRAKYDKYYAAMRNIIRDLSITVEVVDTESIRKKVEDLLTHTDLDPDKLMNVAEEFGIEPEDPVKWREYIEAWRARNEESARTTQDVLRNLANGANDDLTKEESKRFTVTLRTATVRKHGKQGAGEDKRKKPSRAGSRRRAKSTHRGGKKSGGAQPEPRKTHSVGNGEARI